MFVLEPKSPCQRPSVSIGIELATTPGGDAWFGSASHRMPRFSVSRSVGRQLSPNQTAYIGRSVSNRFVNPLRAMLMSKRSTNGLSAARFHFDGSRAPPAGPIALTLAATPPTVPRPPASLSPSPLPPPPPPPPPL